MSLFDLTSRTGVRLPSSPPMVRMYFTELFFSKENTHYGAFYWTPYDASGCVLQYLNEDAGYGEDSILKMQYEGRSPFAKSDGKLISSGRIDGIDFRIMEIQPGDKINLF
jgi:hypothetical protein